MPITRIEIDHDESATMFSDVVDLSEARKGAIGLSNYIKGASGGIYRANIQANVGAVKATGLVTFTGAPTADDTVDIAGVTFTAKASGAAGNEFNIGGSVTITAANLAAAINASTDLASLVTATSAVGVVTLTAYVAGKIGNGLELVDALANATVTAFAGGLDGTENTLELK